MKLSDGEKLIALMLADIMEAGGIKGEIDPSFVKTAIAGDDLWALRWKYDSFFHNEGPSEAIVDETAQIMTMCRVVENSIASLDPAERVEIPAHKQRVFVGFDGNEEPHYGVAVMLIQELDRYDEWADRPLNAHHRTIDKYRRMRAVYDRIELPLHGFELTDIQSILGA
ncbi:YfbU family protein [Sphingomonas sp. gentR]|jgi:uncharacterized protein YfbU (UPF0304 family)|uniref:YfbU family protein n=1 Tax=unclassified Sphingomonas TaxID=196159 RepID=UPI000972B8FC|nr:YfbU family protein [Sphingomonas sp. LK11]APX65016.1 hypothetical protein AV944_03245 [Sphingomonas sp. LK11]